MAFHKVFIGISMANYQMSNNNYRSIRKCKAGSDRLNEGIDC
jgi:hypothetical protein